MTPRENVRAIMKYENHSRMPVIHFGFWPELLQQWHEEGHISKEEVFDWTWTPGNEENKHKLEKRLGFDFNGYNAIGYPDLVSVFMGTTLNQTGQAVEIVAMTMIITSLSEL